MNITSSRIYRVLLGALLSSASAFSQTPPTAGTPPWPYVTSPGPSALGQAYQDAFIKPALTARPPSVQTLPMRVWGQDAGSPGRSTPASATVVSPEPQTAAEGGSAVAAPPVEVINKIAPAVAVVLTAHGGGTAVSSAVVVRNDGVLLTCYHAVKGASGVQVRLKSGEVYDRVELMAIDERRDVVALRIPAAALPTPHIDPISAVETGATVYAISHASALPWSASSGMLSGTRLADEVPGAGAGYRLLQFTAPVSPGASGGALVDSNGHLIGIIVGSIAGQNQNFAVPVESVIGLINSSRGIVLASGAGLNLPTYSAPPLFSPAAPMQGEHAGAAPGPPPDVDDRERSEALASRDPVRMLQHFRTIYVHSKTVWMDSVLLEHELYKRPEFQQWGLVLVKDPRLADFTIEVRVPPFTWDYEYTVTHQNSSMMVVAGKVHAFTGLDAAPTIAKDFMNQIQKTNRPPAKSKVQTASEKKVS